VVGTHGRGVYFFNLDPIHELKELDTRKQFSLLNVSDVQFPKQVDTHRDVDLSTLTAMPVNVWAPTAGKVQISIIGEDDSIYWTKKKRVKKGLNQFLWIWLYPLHQVKSLTSFITNDTFYLVLTACN